MIAITAEDSGRKSMHAPRPYRTACPRCRNVFDVDEKFEGQSTTCPECGSVFVIVRYVSPGKVLRHDIPVRIELPESRKLHVGGRSVHKHEPPSDFTVYTTAALNVAKEQRSDLCDIGVERLGERVEAILESEGMKITRYLRDCGIILGCVFLLSALIVFSVSRREIESNSSNICQPLETSMVHTVQHPDKITGVHNGLVEIPLCEKKAVPTNGEPVDGSEEIAELDLGKSTGLELSCDTNGIIESGIMGKGDAHTEENADIVDKHNAAVSVKECESRTVGRMESHEKSVPGSIDEETAKAWSKYLVIDLSPGLDAERYSVKWLDASPPGGWPDSYKTTKLLLRRIEAGMFMMGSPDSEAGHTDGERRHVETVRHSFYIGVFEVTCRQYQLVMGGGMQSPGGEIMRPATSVSWESIRGNRFENNWPSQPGVDKDSFMGVLRRKTGFSGLDIPTEVQWEYACRAGSDTAFSDGSNLTAKFRCNELAQLGRYVYNPLVGDSSMAEPVGKFVPNPWGLYDMHGNVWEWCRDEWTPFGNASPGTMLDGTVTRSNAPCRTVRGGSYTSYAVDCRSASRASRMASGSYSDVGFRVCCEMDGVASESVSDIPVGDKMEVTGCRLSVGRPKVVKRRASESDSGSGAYYRCGSERYVSVSKYNGKVACNVPRGGRALVCVEAYFVTRDIGDESVEVIGGAKTIGNYAFGDGRPSVYEFSFESPEVSETKSSEYQSGSYYYNGYRRVYRSGTKYLGVIVRMIVDGKVKKVVTVPSNQKWNKAGKETNVVF